MIEAEASWRPAEISALRRRSLWIALLLWAVTWGSVTWAIEAALLRMVPDAPAEPWRGVYRLVETLLWIVAIVVAIRVAERWPITDPRRHWRRIAGQIALGMALGPAWGILAYGLSPYLMPWWRPRGMWGIVAKEAKSMLFGYGTTAVLAHVTLRVAAHRRRALALALAEQRAAQAQLDLLRLQLQPDGVLRSIDAIRALVPRDVDAANAALVLLADSLDAAMDAASARELPLASECANVEAQVRLHGASGRAGFTCAVALDAATESAVVPHGLVQALVEDGLAAAAAESSGLHVRVTAARDGSLVCVLVTVRPTNREAVSKIVARLESGRALAYVREQVRRLAGSRNVPSWRVAAGGEAVAARLELPFREVTARFIQPA